MSVNTKENVKGERLEEFVFDLYKRMAWIMLLGIIVFFVIGQKTFPKNNQIFDTDFKILDTGWTVNETGEEISLPANVSVKRNQNISISNTIPDNVRSGDYICIRSSKQEINVYIDGEFRQSYTTKEGPYYGKTSAVAYMFVRLDKEDSGKELLIDTCTDSNYTGVFYPVYIGDRLGIIISFFMTAGTAAIIAMLTLVMGVICIVVGEVIKYILHKHNDLIYLGCGVFLTAVWIITNSLFRQLMFNNLSVVNDIPFLMILMLPFPFVFYVNSVQKNRYRKVYIALSTFLIIDFVVCVVLHVTRKVDYADTISVMAAICLLTIAIIGITVLCDIKNGKIKQYFWVAIGLFSAFIASCIQIGVYFLRIVDTSGIFLAFGLMLLIIASIIGTIRSIIEMDRAKDRAEMKSKTKADFLANMSHEIRTPINAVLGMNSMILRECDDEIVKDYAMDIKSAGENLLSIINEILDFSKIESGKMEINPIDYELSSLIHDISNMVSLKAEEKNLKLDIFVDKMIPARLYGDEIRLRQIIINLLNNAVKYTEKGSVSLTINGRRENDNEDEVLKVVIKDTGIGIKEEDIPKLYSAFERIEEERNRSIEGTGLGMSIVVQLLALMGSKLEVKSEYGVGSEFSFEIRQKIMSDIPVGNIEERINNQKSYDYKALFLAEDAKLLVVDDNIMNIKVFRSLLKQNKVKIDSAESGMQCLDMIKNKRYDIIFLDHMMPNMDGIETIHRLRNDKTHMCQGVPVIALTANAISGAREMYLSEGFDDYLSKPIIPDKLEDQIRRYLDDDKIGEIVSKKENVSNDLIENELPAIEGIDWEFALLHIPDKDILWESFGEFYRSMEGEARQLKEYFDIVKDSYDYIDKNSTSQSIDEDNSDELEEVFAKPNENLELMEEMSARLNENLNLMEEMSTKLNENLDLYRIKVHAMKSSSALVGGFAISGVAKMLEYLARDKKVKDVINMSPVFFEEWQAMHDRIQEYFKEDEVELQELEDYSILNENFEKLKNAMTVLDVDEADNQIAELKKYAYGEEETKIIRQLEDAVLNLDTDKVIELIERLQ